MDRPALDLALEELARTPNDNNEHLAYIRDQVVGVNAMVVVELGVGYGRSTCALLTGLAQTGGRLFSCDVEELPGVRAKWQAPNWSFTVQNDLAWGASRPWGDGPIDLLMIDTTHTREQTLAELKLFGPHVRPGGKILLHDTISFPTVLEAIHAWVDHAEWQGENRNNNNGLATLTRRAHPTYGRCGVALGGDPNSTSGPDVLLAGLAEALRFDKRFVAVERAAPDEVIWFPTFHRMPEIIAAVMQKRPIAIGPNVLWGNSQTPNAGPHEPILANYTGFRAIFSLSRWYAESLRRNMAQQTAHHLVDFILPLAWQRLPWRDVVTRDALIFCKGGPEEAAICDRLAQRFPSSTRLVYGQYKRADLLEAARTSRACFYVSREDHYPLAAVEIGLMGCPIVSDERACPVLAHRLTGITVPVRERCDHETFKWAPGSGDALAGAWRGALELDRTFIHEATLHRHDGRAGVERIASALGL